MNFGVSRHGYFETLVVKLNVSTLKVTTFAWYLTITVHGSLEVCKTLVRLPIR